MKRPVIITAALAGAVLAVNSTLAAISLAGPAADTGVPANPVITAARTIPAEGTLAVTVRLPAGAHDIEVDAETAGSTPDAPGPHAIGFHHGTVRAGQPFTVRLNVPDSPGAWHVSAVYADYGWHFWPVHAPFTITRAPGNPLAGIPVYR